MEPDLLHAFSFTLYFIYSFHLVVSQLFYGLISILLIYLLTKELHQHLFLMLFVVVPFNVFGKKLVEATNEEVTFIVTSGSKLIDVFILDY